MTWGNVPFRPKTGIAVLSAIVHNDGDGNGSESRIAATHTHNVPRDPLPYFVVQSGAWLDIFEFVVQHICILSIVMFHGRLPPVVVPVLVKAGT